mmetsp:Transcript_67114/g.202627  ORF Transcript_67114/g.202627 Transcript_67114/m.202627 type:complete len:187 (-) Transcript_67114:322-882(-)
MPRPLVARGGAAACSPMAPAGAGAWEEAAVDAAAALAAEAQADALGLRWVLEVEGSTLPPVTKLAGFLRTALHRTMCAALGPVVQRQRLQVQVRPGSSTPASAGGKARAAFRFSVLPADRTLALHLAEHLRLEAEYHGSVCLLPELQAQLEESGHVCQQCCLRLEVLGGRQTCGADTAGPATKEPC